MRTVTITVGTNRMQVPCHKRDKISISVSGKTQLLPKQDALNCVSFKQEKAKGI